MASSNKRNKKQSCNNGQGNRSSGNRGSSPSQPKEGYMRGKQSKADSKDPRVNLDNVRKDKLVDKINADSKKEGANDVSWYSKNPELLRSAASLPVASILGDAYFKGQAADRPEGSTVPGIFRWTWDPAFGAGGAPVAINQAADSAYSFIVSANSRDFNQTAPDYFIMINAGMQAYLIVAAMLRAYGVMRDYKEETRYLPKYVVQTMGFNPDDLLAKRGQAWFDLNNLIDQLRQIWVPNAFPVMERWMWYNLNYYKDAEGDRAQIYVPVQQHYYEYDETGVPTGGRMIIAECCERNEKDGSITHKGIPFVATDNPVTGANQGHPWNQWVGTAQNMINKLIESEDRSEIYGNILNAYGKERLYQLNPVTPDFTVEAAYNTEVLMQIENIVTSPVFVTQLCQYNEDIYPAYDNSWQWTMSVGAPSAGLLNFHTATQPSPEMIAVATRSMTIGGIVDANHMQSVMPTKVVEGKTWAESTPQAQKAVQNIPLAIGSEIVHDFWVFTIDHTNLATPSGFRIDQMNWTGNTATMFLRLMAFDWHPFIYEINKVKSGATTIVASDVGTIPNQSKEAYGDFDNYTEISPAELRKIHDAALMSL